MPHLKGLALPPPEHHQEFEVLCLELMKAMKRPVVEPNLYGRSGQSQHGIDFALQLTDGLHGYQCKRVDSFTFAQFEAELGKTATFPNPIRSWTVLATAPNDARLLDDVATLSLRRADAAAFPVTVVFWSTIRDWLADHPAVTMAHYGQTLGGPPRRKLTVEDHRELENLLARHERKRLSAAQVLGHLKARGYATEGTVLISQRLVGFRTFRGWARGSCSSRKRAGGYPCPTSRFSHANNTSSFVPTGFPISSSRRQTLPLRNCMRAPRNDCMISTPRWQKQRNPSRVPTSGALCRWGTGTTAFCSLRRPG